MIIEIVTGESTHQFQVAEEAASENLAVQLMKSFIDGDSRAYVQVADYRYILLNFDQAVAIQVYHERD